MKFILGKKMEMTQKYSETGEVIPVTKILAGPCYITQIKTKATDGYNGVQIGFGERKKLNKALSGHLKNLPKLKYFQELRLPDNFRGELKVGDIIKADALAVGDIVKVTGTSKGRGFQGVVKRHGFSGQPATHGHKDQARMPGASGPGGVQHVRPGVPKPGHMGNAQITVTNLKIIEVDANNNWLYVKGAVPGSRGSLVVINGELK